MTTQHVFHQLYNVSCSDDINIMINKAVAKKKKNYTVLTALKV